MSGRAGIRTGASVAGERWVTSARKHSEQLDAPCDPLPAKSLKSGFVALPSGAVWVKNAVEIVAVLPRK